MIITQDNLPILPNELKERFDVNFLLDRNDYKELYMVNDKESGKPCVLKIFKMPGQQSQLLPTKNGPLDVDKIKENFIESANILAKCQHPNIVKIVEMCVENYSLYLIMENIEGKNLEEIIEEKGKLSFKEILEKSEIILSALDYIHSIGVIHNNLKPKNILIEGGSGRIVIIGFYISKYRFQLHKSNTQSVRGNQYYMPPEQWKTNDNVENKTDIYAYGGILFKMLTGDVPFKGTMEKVLHGHLFEDVPDVNNWLPDPPKGIQEILKKAMAKTPGYRYPEALAFLNTLKKVKHDAL